jgi:hypothetical protein
MQLSIAAFRGQKDPDEASVSDADLLCVTHSSRGVAWPWPIGSVNGRDRRKVLLVSCSSASHLRTASLEIRVPRGSIPLDGYAVIRPLNVGSPHSRWDGQSERRSLLPFPQGCACDRCHSLYLRIRRPFGTRITTWRTLLGFATEAKITSQRRITG